jgi:hypothetical protein
MGEPLQVPKSGSGRASVPTTVVTDEGQRQTQRWERQSLCRFLMTEKDREKMYEAKEIRGVSVTQILLQTKTVKFRRI